MITDLQVAWRQLRARPVQSLIPALVIAIAIGTSIAVLALGDAARRGIVQASDPFGVLIVGPKGSGQQLVLNSVLLQGEPLGTIPSTIYDELTVDTRVRLAVPVAQGDNLGGAPVIGTNTDFFELRPDINAPPAFALREGRLFEADFEAVLGSSANELLGLTIGDTFQSSHGAGAGLASDQHEEVYTVVGILSPSETAYDNAVYTTIESIWDVHEVAESGSPLVISSAEEGLTSILVQPVSFVEQNHLWQDFYIRTDAQAVFPGQELGALFDLLRQGEQILTAVGYLMLGIAALTVFLALYGAALTRERDVAVLRSLGAGRWNVFRMALFEALLLTIGGALLGRLVGYGAALVMAAIFSSRSAIPLPIRFLSSLELVLWLLPLLIGLLAGLLPAMLSYRVDVAEKLTAT